MKKTWVHFKLRMMQLKHDKTGLFFSYVFPVLLLLGIGYPIEMADNKQIEVAYVRADTEAQRLMETLSKNDLIEFESFDGDRDKAERALRDNQIQHLLDVAPAASPQTYRLVLATNSLNENRVAALALVGILRDAAASDTRVAAVERRVVPVSPRSSYVAVLLPGVIAMTLLIIGLNGFGSTLIEEESQGLYKNLKTIDVSPVSFLSGLFFSRLLIAYSVALGMFAVSALVLDVSTGVNYPLLMIIVTLGCAMFLAMGLLIFLLSKTVMAFNGVVSVIQIPLVLLGGVFFSTSMFPDWLRPFADYSPLAPFTSTLRDLMFGGVGFHNVSQLYPSMIVMVGWLAAFLLLSKWKFRW
jgi:ABC-2 type transport system permease protein